MTAAAARRDEPAVIRPFLKWVGGKRQLLPELWKSVPETFGRYVEPFVGGGALFFELRARGWSGRAILNDVNWHVAQTYRAVSESVEDVIRALRRLRYDKAQYLALRAKMPNDIEHTAVEAAVWTIYMNRCGFNGLWRVNKKGQFNVPFGRYTNPTICDEPVLWGASAALQVARIMNGDFEGSLISVKRGDLVYFDPPYVPVSATANFTGYAKDGFNLDDQKRLRDCAARLKRLGAHVILSNADVPLVRELYKGFHIRAVSARRNVNSKASSRGAVGEVIIT